MNIIKYTTTTDGIGVYTEIMVVTYRYMVIVKVSNLDASKV